MSGSRVLRKRKHEQETDNTGKKKTCQDSKRTRESHAVDKHPSTPSGPDLSPLPIRSDIGVTTHSSAATSTKKKKFSVPDQSPGPDASRTDDVIGEPQSRSEIDALRSRLQELEEERNDYHDSLRKETEKAMERGRRLLLLQARAATTEQREVSSTKTRHQPSLDHKDKEIDKADRLSKAAQRHESPIVERLPSGETKARRDASVSSGSVLERELQKQVEDLSIRLSEAESETAERVSQVLRLFKYKYQDEKFAAQSHLMCTEDSKLAQAVEEQKRNNDVRLLGETNNHLSEKLQQCCSSEAKLQTEILELRASLEVSASSRDEVATKTRAANQSHSREQARLEGRIQGLESEIAKARLKIEQLNEEKSSMTSRQGPGESTKSPSHKRPTLVEGIEGLRCWSKKLQARNSSLANNLLELNGRFQNLDSRFLESQRQLHTAESKIGLLKTVVHDAGAKHAENVKGLEARTKELSESLTKTTAEMAKRDEELSTLRATVLEKERALQNEQENHRGTSETLTAKIHEASKADAEIARLRCFEHAVTEHDRAVKRLERGREEMFRQQQERLSALTEARKQLMLQVEQNRELQRSNEALERSARESGAAKKEGEARFIQFLQFVEAQTRRQIEEPGGELEAITEISRPGDATLKQLEDRLQKKLDMIDYELQWYKDDRAKIYDEYRRLEQWRNEMASNVAARLRMITGSRPSGN